MRNLLLGVATLVSGAVPAAAADLPRMPVKAPPPPVVATWTGCYVGFNAGFGWSHEDWFDPFVSRDEGSHTRSGGMAGGQIGCDLQTGPFVVGVQFMMDGGGLDGSHPY